MEPEPLIAFDRVSVTLGGLPVLTDIDLRIDAGDIPNEQALKALIAALPVQVPAPPIRRVS